jgi:hypothetical protein
VLARVGAHVFSESGLMRFEAGSQKQRFDLSRLLEASLGVVRPEMSAIH